MCGCQIVLLRELASCVTQYSSQALRAQVSCNLLHGLHGAKHADVKDSATELWSVPGALAIGLHLALQTPRLHYHRTDPVLGEYKQQIRAHAWHWLYEQAGLKHFVVCMVQT